jgi:hypothetical protein
MITNKSFKTTLYAKGTEIAIYATGTENDYISLTDIAKYKNPEFPADVVKNWLRSKSTIEFLGLWEELNNPNFKVVEFDHFKSQAGSNAFVLSPQKWIKSTDAIGLVSRSGRNGGTFAHKDIAFEFASWISPEFKLYIIKDYQRVKTEENSRLSLEWNVNRVLAKLNYRIHTEAIKENLITNELTPRQINFTYANEADLLNVVLFGQTAKEWRDKNLNLKGNIRDYATIEQLIVLVNLENINAQMINKGVEQKTRIIELDKIAKRQMQSFLNNGTIKKLDNINSIKPILKDGEPDET